jgi:putative ABC transport system permease protein
MSFLLEIIRLGLSNLRLHKVRAFLTTLGIILGVAAVITMVSLGEGAKRDALTKIERLGAKNIIIRSQKPAEQQSQSSSQSRQSWVSRFGITRDDFEVIQTNFPDAEDLVPLKEIGSQILREDKRKISQAYGTTPRLLTVANLRIGRGRYLSQADVDESATVCVVGAEVAREFFPLDDPVGQAIRIDSKPFTVVGVLAPVGLSGGAGAALVGRDLNLDIHVPISAARAVFSDLVRRSSSGSFQANEVQISEIYLTVPTRDRVMSDAERVRRIMEVRHPGMTDIGMIVPYELLESARKTALTFNLVSGAIAGVALLVGGIGIMNIMLATVTERTREIGIRRAVGATRSHILLQFIVETGVLSAMGGAIGVALGIGASLFIGWVVPLLPTLPVIGNLFPQDVALPTAVTLWSVILSFSVAVGTGLIFGIYPARKAAAQDPIVALRHD